MKYQYNYSFLGKWMSMNRNISIDTILQAIGTTSNNSLRLWSKGKSPMPVTAIMRFCNTFQVPISAFFCDKDAEHETTTPYIKPDINDKFEPDGGYVSERQQGCRGLYDPLDVTFIPSVIPGVALHYPQADFGESKTGSVSDTRNMGEKIYPVNAFGNISDKNMATILEFERKRIEQDERNTKERARLLDIIAELQKQNVALANMLMHSKENKTDEIDNV